MCNFRSSLGKLAGSACQGHNSFWVDSKSGANVAKSLEANQPQNCRRWWRWLLVVEAADSVRLQTGCNFNKKMISVWQIGKTFAAFCSVLFRFFFCILSAALYFQTPAPVLPYSVIHLYGNFCVARCAYATWPVITISIRTTCAAESGRSIFGGAEAAAAAAGAEINKKQLPQNGNGNKSSRWMLNCGSPPSSYRPNYSVNLFVWPTDYL